MSNFGEKLRSLEKKYQSLVKYLPTSAPIHDFFSAAARRVKNFDGGF
jgi:hypothetical protein